MQQDQKQNKKIPQTNKQKNIFWFYSLDQLFWLLDGEEICPKFEAIYDRFNRRISHLSVEWIFCLVAYEFKHKNCVFLNIKKSGYELGGIIHMIWTLSF